MEHDSYDSGALPPLLFEPELDSDGQQSLEENTPPDSALIPNSANRNEAKLSLSSYQSVTLGEVTPTREVSPNDFKDNNIPGKDVTPKHPVLSMLKKSLILKALRLFPTIRKQEMMLRIQTKRQVLQ